MTSSQEWADTNSLLTASRLDVAGKLPLARAIVQNRRDPWSRELFFACLDSMRPLGDFQENGTKFKLSDYEMEFRLLIESLSEVGFRGEISRIPIDSTGGLWNGAHRVAASIALGLQSVPVERTNEVPQIYDFEFFKNTGLPDHYLSELAWNFFTTKKATRALVFSNLGATKTNQLLRDLRTIAPLVFVKKQSLTAIGQRRLMDLCYGHLGWFSPELAEKLKLERFPDDADADTTVAFYELPGSVTEREIKEKLRERLSSEDFIRRIHGTDDWEETKRIAEVWTNNNSLFFLNHSPLGSELRVTSYIESLRLGGYAREGFLVDGGAVLEMFGIRQTEDLDHICVTSDCAPLTEVGDCHNAEYSALGLSTELFVTDPRWFFRWSGIKFATLDLVASRHIRLGSEKSSEDLMSVTVFLSGKQIAKANSAELDLRRKKWIRRSKRQIFVEKLLEKLPTNLRRLVAFMARNLRRALNFRHGSNS